MTDIKQKAKELIDKCYLEMSDFNVSDEVLVATSKRIAINTVNEMYTLASYLDDVPMMNYCVDVENEIKKV